MYHASETAKSNQTYHTAVNIQILDLSQFQYYCFPFDSGIDKFILEDTEGQIYVTTLIRCSQSKDAVLNPMCAYLALHP